MSFNSSDLNHPQTRIICCAEIVAACAPFGVPQIKWDQQSLTLDFDGFMITRNENNTYDVSVAYEIPGTRDTPPDGDVYEMEKGLPLYQALGKAIAAYYGMRRDAYLETLDWTAQDAEFHPERVYYNAIFLLKDRGIDVCIAGNTEPEEGT